MGMTNKISKGIDDIKVELINATYNPIPTMYTFIMSTWGDLITDTDKVDDDEMFNVVQEAITGKRFAGAVLETVNYTFAISNVSRAFTHQMVRTRIGAGFAQQGGRDNNWINFDFRMPDTIANNEETRKEFERAIEHIKDAYATAISNGIPFQDARFICPIGLQTNICVTINLRALSEWVANRLCNCMQWEINTVARMMVTEVLKVHSYFEPVLKARCERIGKCIAKPTLFPPCGKYDRPDGWGVKKYEHDGDMNGNVILGRVNQDKERLNPK